MKTCQKNICHSRLDRESSLDSTKGFLDSRFSPGRSAPAEPVCGNDRNNKYIVDMNGALDKLVNKYGIRNRAVFVPAASHAAVEAFLKMSSGQTRMLLPWRVERRFTELKNIVVNGTLEDISTLRFCAISSGNSSSLDQLLYRKFDLCEYLGAANIKSLFAVCNGKNAANVIVKLANGLNCSVECSVMLPAGAEEIDRHEIIARRGVASDRAVDTQIPQSSIYTFTGKGEKRFTDADSELFGFAPASVNLIRAAFTVLSDPKIGKTWNKQHERLLKIVAAAKESDKTGKQFFVGLNNRKWVAGRARIGGI